nr:zinc finger BED domain-containing protein RICESLEEPER 2 [Tanacetum cinerariifolium]
MVNQRRKRKPYGEKGPLQPKKHKTEDIFQSKWWKFYDHVYKVDEEVIKVRKSKCKFCEKYFLQADTEEGGSASGSIATWKHDDDRITKDLGSLFVEAELPFRLVKYPALIRFSHQNKPFLIGDCLTRWNSTHDMLKAACELEKAFELYDVGNSSFSNDRDNVPNVTDFKVRGDLVCFFKKFKSKTQNVSASTKPFSQLFFREIINVDIFLRKLGVKEGYRSMVHKMRLKYDKYWGKWEKLNAFMYFVVLLDPKTKTFLDKHGFRKMITYRITKEKPLTKNAIDAIVEKMIGEVKDRMEVLFRMYEESQLVEALLSTQDWIRRERMEINMDEIEDLLNDNVVIKEMEEAIQSYKGKQVMKH